MNPTVRMFVLGAVLVVAAPVAAQTLQLADGQVLLGTVDDANGDGLRVHRLDNGGSLDLRWDHLAPDCALRIKTQFSLVAVQEEEVTVSADLVAYTQDGSPKEVIGRIVERDPQLVVQVKGLTYRVPRTEVRSVKKVDVPVQQIFTKDEYYQSRLDALAPGDNADKNVLLAAELIRVRDYDHAQVHLDKAKELGKSPDKKVRDEDQLNKLIDKNKRYKDSELERDLIDKIHACRVRGTGPEFDKGMKLIAQYDAEYPGTKAKLRTSDFDGEKKLFDAAHQRFLTIEVAEQWRRSVTLLAEKKAGETGLTLQAAREYCENKIKDDIVARVAQQVGVKPEEVRPLFADRAKFPQGKRTDFFSYGIGSWVLTEKGILKDTAQGKVKVDKNAAKDPAQERDMAQVAKAIRQALERRKAAAQATQGQGQAPQEPTDEDWWKEASRAEKTSWMRAYYAENGGDLVVARATLMECSSCFGEGTVVQVAAEGSKMVVKCYLCHGTKWLRSLTAY